jgi:7-cyano-7-deazaguanine synthase
LGLIVVMTGGGIKGAVAAAGCADEQEIVFFHVSYGQRSANAELNAVQALCTSLPAARVVEVNMPHVLQLQDRLAEVRERSGARRKAGAGVSRVLSPAAHRGLWPVLASAAVQCALQLGASTVVVGLSRLMDATHLGLPQSESQRDRRRELLHAHNVMLDALEPQQANVQIDAPLIDRTDVEIVKLAHHFCVPLENTWTCSQSGPRPCQRCDQCVARAYAFAAAGFADPVINLPPAQVRSAAHT